MQNLRSEIRKIETEVGSKDLNLRRLHNEAVLTGGMSPLLKKIRDRKYKKPSGRKKKSARKTASRGKKTAGRYNRQRQLTTIAQPSKETLVLMETAYILCDIIGDLSGADLDCTPFIPSDYSNEQLFLQYGSMLM